jgi:hypothetical protein
MRAMPCGGAPRGGACIGTVPVIRGGRNYRCLIEYPSSERFGGYRDALDPTVLHYGELVETKVLGDRVRTADAAERLCQSIAYLPPRAFDVGVELSCCGFTDSKAQPFG